MLIGGLAVVAALGCCAVPIGVLGVYLAWPSSPAGAPARAGADADSKVAREPIAPAEHPWFNRKLTQQEVDSILINMCGLVVTGENLIVLRSGKTQGVQGVRP